MPDRAEVIRVLQNIHDNGDFGADLIAAAGWALDALNNSTEIVRCRDCVHAGHPDPNNLLYGTWACQVFPDTVCPCQCDDFYYSWLPDPDWFCANGERRVSGDA